MEKMKEFVFEQAQKEGFFIGALHQEMEKNIFYIKNLLTMTYSDISKIAQLVDVSEDFVLKVKNGLIS